MQNRVSTSPFTLILWFSFRIVTCSHGTWYWRQPRTQTLSAVQRPLSATGPIELKSNVNYTKTARRGQIFWFFRFLFAEFAGFGFGFGLLLADWLFAFNLSYVIICVYLFNDSRCERVNAPAWHHESKNRVIAQVPPS